MAHIYHPQLHAFELYHLENNTSAPSSILAPALPALGHALSGSTASALSNLLLFPLDLIITRLQVQRNTSKSASNHSTSKQSINLPNEFRNIYKNEGGFAAFYKGVAPDTLKSVLDGFIFFLVYEFARRKRRGGRGRNLPAIEQLGIGVLAGAVAKFVTSPLGCVVTRLQTTVPISDVDAGEPGRREHGIRDVIEQIKNEKGWKGFWSGYEASLILTLNPSITFFLYQLYDKVVPGGSRTDKGKRAVRTFLMAAVAKAVASTIMYPVMLTKARAQVEGSEYDARLQTVEKGKAPAEEKTTKDKAKAKASSTSRLVKRNSTLNTLTKIYKQEGPSALYSGLEAEILKGFLGHGTTMAIKQVVHRFVIQLYFTLLKLLRRYPSPEELAGRAKTSTLETAAGLQETASSTRESLQAGTQLARQKLKDGAETGNQAKETVNGKVQGFLSRVRTTYDKLWDPVSLATLGTATRKTEVVGSVGTAEDFVSKEAGHLLGNAQGMLEPKVSRKVE